MKTTITSKSKAEVIFQSIGNSLFQVLQYNDIGGYSNYKSFKQAKDIYDCNDALRQVKVILKNSTIKVQNEILSYMKGDIGIKDKKIKSSSITRRLLGIGEKTGKISLSGTGEVYFKPSFKYFSLIELYDEEIIVDEDIFYICEDSIKINIEDGEILLDKDKLQIKLSGSGIVILLMNVPESEIVRCKLFNDKLTVDGDFAVLRSGSIDVSIESINNYLNDSDISEKEYLHVYEGIGEVWILPTLSCYEDFSEDIDENQEE